MAGRKPIPINLKAMMVKLDSLEAFGALRENLDLASVELEELTTIIEIELVNMN